ncbi:MAG: DUF937 domain-containing protein [Rhodothermales bacterium]|nr:DUF937 domain-containing protein [Rhodothermales bacterium]
MDLMQLIGQYVTPETINQISQQVGATPQQTQSAVATALPALLGGLAQNTQSPQGAAALDQALERDHDGGLLDRLGGLLGGGQGSSGLGGLLGGVLASGAAASVLGSIFGGGDGNRAANGAGILGHIFGGKTEDVSGGVSQASGLNRGQSMQILLLLAPLVMQVLGRMKRQQGLGAQDVAGVLQQERAQINQQAESAGLGGIGKILDRDGDGSIADDLAKLGAVVGGAYVASRMSQRGS